MKLRSTLNVVACEQDTDKDGKLVQTKDGKPKYRIAHKVFRKVKVGAKEIDAEEVETMTSLIELKPGQHDVELNVFAIASGTKANIYYQVKSLSEQPKLKKAE